MKDVVSTATIQSDGLCQHAEFDRFCVKAHTHRPIFRGFVAESAVESADSIPESGESTDDSVIVGQLPYQTCLIVF